jgi:cobyrinic acid a,c-diamide synthase
MGTTVKLKRQYSGDGEMAGTASHSGRARDGAGVAALIHGFQSFDPELRVAGVIFNRIAGAGHLLREALEAFSMTLLGGLPTEVRSRCPSDT